MPVIYTGKARQLPRAHGPTHAALRRYDAGGGEMEREGELSYCPQIWASFSVLNYLFVVYDPLGASRIASALFPNSCRGKEIVGMAGGGGGQVRDRESGVKAVNSEPHALYSKGPGSRSATLLYVHIPNH